MVPFKTLLTPINDPLSNLMLEVGLACTKYKPLP